MRYYDPSHAATKLIVLLLLIFIIIGVAKGTDIIVFAISAFICAMMLCVIIISGLFILIKALF